MYAWLVQIFLPILTMLMLGGLGLIAFVRFFKTISTDLQGGMDALGTMLCTWEEHAAKRAKTRLSKVRAQTGADKCRAQAQAEIEAMKNGGVVTVNPVPGEAIVDPAGSTSEQSGKRKSGLVGSSFFVSLSGLRRRLVRDAKGLLHRPGRKREQDAEAVAGGSSFSGNPFRKGSLLDDLASSSMAAGRARVLVEALLWHEKNGTLDKFTTDQRTVLDFYQTQTGIHANLYLAGQMRRIATVTMVVGAFTMLGTLSTALAQNGYRVIRSTVEGIAFAGHGFVGAVSDFAHWLPTVL